MARVCMRPGCDRVAVARLSYDTISCEVWLDDVPDRPTPVQELCELHAGRLTVPRGWTLLDRRGAAALLETVGVATVTVELEPGPAPVEPRVAQTVPVVDGMSPTAVVEPADLVDAAASAGNGDQRAPSAQSPDVESPGAESRDDESPDDESRDREPSGEDELPEALQATSPLLSRAFSTTGHQRSVLTQSLGEHDG